MVFHLFKCVLVIYSRKVSFILNNLTEIRCKKSGGGEAPAAFAGWGSVWFAVSFGFSFFLVGCNTKISPIKTIAEISQTLVSHKANRIVVDYENSTPVSVSFMIASRDDVPMFFRLPCNFKGVLAAMEKDSRIPKGMKTEEQAIRVGWRIVKDWVEAQCAIVDGKLALPEEVFLPYAVTKSGKTLFESMSDVRPMLLEG